MSKVSRNPLEIRDGDSLGMVVLKAAGQGAVYTVACYGGMIGAFAGISYISKKIDSMKEKRQETVVVEESEKIVKIDTDAK